MLDIAINIVINGMLVGHVETVCAFAFDNAKSLDLAITATTR